MKTLEALRTLDHIMHVDDEREMGNSIIVTLAEGWFFADEPDCGVQGFDKVSDARRGCARKKVVYDPERYARLNAPVVPVSAPQPQSVVDAAEVSAYDAVHARIVSGDLLDPGDLQPGLARGVGLQVGGTSVRQAGAISCQ